MVATGHRRRPNEVNDSMANMHMPVKFSIGPLFESK
jgi:hypothetical protein